jgi:hypothetical protein
MSDTCSKSISLINTRTSNRGCKLFNIDLNFNETNNFSNYKKLNLTFSDFEIYNDKYLMIKNTKCLIDYEKDIKSIKNIISVLNNNFNNKNNLHTRKFMDYLIIYV